MLFVGASCATRTTSSRPPDETQRSASPADPLQTCWRVAADDRLPPIATLAPVSDSVVFPEDFITLPLHLRLTNIGLLPLWVNKRGAHGGPGIADLWLRIDAADGKVADPEGEGDRWLAGSGDYAALPVGQSIEIVVRIRRSEYRFRPGQYTASVCLWDQNPSAPAAPQGAVHLDRAIAASPIHLTIR